MSSPQFQPFTEDIIIPTNCEYLGQLHYSVYPGNFNTNSLVPVFIPNTGLVLNITRYFPHIVCYMYYTLWNDVANWVNLEVYDFTTAQPVAQYRHYIRPAGVDTCNVGAVPSRLTWGRTPGAYAFQMRWYVGGGRARSHTLRYYFIGIPEQT